MLNILDLLNIKPKFCINEKLAKEKKLLQGWIFFSEIPDLPIIIEIIYLERKLKELKNNIYRKDLELKKYDSFPKICGFFEDLNKSIYPNDINFSKLELKIKNSNFFLKKIDNENLVDFINVSKKYETNQKDNWIFRNFNLSIKKNENIGIIGKNGQGKTTFLNLLGGVDNPDSGKIIRNCSVSWPIGRAGGFQGSLTARENCKFVCKLYYGKKNKQIKVRLSEIEAFADIGNYFDMPIKTLSSGMKSRVSFALSVAIEFDIYLVDEITSVGDLEFRNKCYEKFDLIKKKASIVMVSHNLNEIQNHCNKVILLNDKKMKFFNNVKEGIDFYKLL